MNTYRAPKKSMEQLAQEAVSNVIEQAQQRSLQVTSINLYLRSAPKVGDHVHATATCKIKLHHCAQNKESFDDVDKI